ncbi:HNH endonuclease [Chryseobacterium sp. RLHN22]|jgi:hypothetical protein|uniref:HNH endonuclease n=1 Tax=Chryseobacterium sp. RLHN22 TaxID=3437885 RepID=UPI003D9BF919
MNCIFCKKDSTNSKSVEHIIPESFGNKKHILKKGMVCDSCNKYFSTKIEKEVSELDFFTNIRFRNFIPSKKNRIPKGKAILPKTKYLAEVDLNKGIQVTLDSESFNLVEKGEITSLTVPYKYDYPKDNISVSRLLAKMAFEMLALRVIKTNKDLIDFVNEPQFDKIRNYVRSNPKNENWVYSSRKIYSENEKFYLKDGKSVDMIFECDFLPTNRQELYFVFVYKGIEFVINMAGSSIDGYLEWLKLHNDISPLYREGSNFGYDLTPEFLKNN